MGTWNFGPPQVTDGIKVIRICDCNQDCDCYEYAEEHIEEMKNRFSSIKAVLEYKISKNYSLHLQLEPIEPIIEHGYYKDIALDYNSDYEVEINVFRNDDEELPNLNDKAAFKKMIKASGLPINYKEEILWAAEENKDTVLFYGTSLSPTDREFFSSLLRNHANAVIPTSVSVGWCSGEYETTVEEPTVPNGASWNAYCDI